jgi:MinD-like ATPase involved in chromosome partitioning or flagellar assembly
LQSPPDWIVFDGGAGVSDQTAPLWQVANYVLLVAQTEPISVMDTYAALKAAAAQIELPQRGVVINQCTSCELADAVSARIVAAARNFLNLRLDTLPAIPLASELAGGTADSRRLLKDSAPRNAFAALAEHLCSSVRRPTVRAA